MTKTDIPKLVLFLIHSAVEPFRTVSPMAILQGEGRVEGGEER